MSPPPDSDETGPPALRSDESVEKRVETLASWMRHIDLQLQATATAVDEKALRELRRTIEALAKRDPRFEDRVTNRVDVVADRVASLAKTVSNTTATLAARDGEMAAVRRELREGSARMEAVMSELRRTLDAASGSGLQRPAPASDPKKPPKGADRQLDALSGKVDVFAQRLDTLAGTVGATAAGLAGREGELAALRRKLEDDAARVDAAIEELRRSVDPLPVLELRQEVKTLSQATAAVKRSSRRGVEEVTNQLTALASHVDWLAKTVTGAASDVAEREAEIAALRTLLEEENTRLDSQVVKLHQAIDTVTSQVAGLEGGADRDTVEALADRLRDTRERCDGLLGRLDALDSRVEATAKDQGDGKVELAALTRRFEEASARVDALVDDLRTARETMPELGPDPAVESRLDTLADSVAALASQVERMEAASTASSEERAWVREQIEDLGARLGATADAAAQTQAEMATLRTSFDEETARHDSLGGAVDALAAQVDGLALAVEESARNEADKEADVAALIDRFQRASARVDVLVGDLRTALETMPEPGLVPDLEPRIDHLAHVVEALERRLAKAEAATAAAWTGSSTAGAELERRLGEAAQTNAMEIARATASWSSELASLQGRLEQALASTNEPALQLDDEARGILAGITARLDEMEARLGEVESVPTSSAPEPSLEQEIGRLRALVDGLGLRVASSERDLAMVAGSRDAADRLDELTARLDALEHGSFTFTASAPSPPLPGDGRFRLELRGLELRMEHAEAAARENREAVLVQLERLASRIEWRLHRLEALEAGAAFPQAGGMGPVGQVVPIRGNDT